MKVKDLINLLQQADLEQEVFASPLILLPAMELNFEKGTLQGKEMERVTNPFKRYEITDVGLFTDLKGGQAKKYILLGYNKDHQPETFSRNEFVN